jgi:thioesterase DpgC
LRSRRNAFNRVYADFIFERITGGCRRPIRAEELVYQATEIAPGLCPTRKEVEAESRLLLAEKEGVEIAQADFLASVFSRRNAGLYLIHSMLRPLPQSRDLLEKFQRDGELNLGKARVERRPPQGCLLYSNLQHLNAEDDTTVLPLETGTDLILMDPEIEVGVLRGNRVEHSKYRGRRIFSAGLNLTHLYHGKISFLFYLTRELGFVNKIHRGLEERDFDPEGPEDTLEKIWIAGLEGFAIGGGCQMLLVMDYVIAEEGSYFNLPARKEGIIPGVSPLRLSRFLGERTAQEGILFDATFPVESSKARGLISEVVPPERMDEAINGAVRRLAGSGLVSSGANRKAIRVGQESRDQLREYMALYCREQASCHFSPALVSNLERNWDARNRQLKA